MKWHRAGASCAVLILALAAPQGRAQEGDFGPVELLYDGVGWNAGVKLATGVGRWIAIWSSQDSLGGTIGTDFDILVARSVSCEGVNDCSGNGVCIDDDTCRCAEGFGGLSCAIAIPTVSAWGLAAMTLVLATTGTIILRRRLAA